MSYGQEISTLASLDSSLTVSAGGTSNGTSKDVGANTSPQAFLAVAQFSLTQTGANDAADLEVIVQFSDDDTNWPDDGQGTSVFNWVAGSAGADLTRSQLCPFLVLARYFRFQYTNNNGTDSFDVDSEISTIKSQND